MTEKATPTSKWWEKTVYTVETVRSGQVRRYGPIVNEYRVTITDADGVPVGWDDHIVKGKLQHLLGPGGTSKAWQSEKGAPDSEWWHFILMLFKRTEPGHWHVLIQQEYLD